MECLLFIEEKVFFKSSHPVDPFLLIYTLVCSNYMREINENFFVPELLN